MSNSIEIARADELEDGQMKAVPAGEREILLARVGDNYYAVDNLCTHMKGRLSEGTLDGYTVTCPRHGSQFDLRTGEVVRWLKGSGLASRLASADQSPRPLDSYPVEVRDGGIWIEI